MVVVRAGLVECAFLNVVIIVVLIGAMTTAFTYFYRALYFCTPHQ